jgi:hypothetical protein
MLIADFIAKWAASSAAERANKDAFLIELCDVLDVPRPDPTTGDEKRDRYVFEKDALMPHAGGKVSRGKIDLYRAGAFILEAKQGSDATSKKLGTAKRDTPAWNVAMMSAYGQALAYARTFDEPVPFLITCDIGHCFDLYAAFDGSYLYRAFPNAQLSRIHFQDIERHKSLLQAVFLDPYSLDPARKAAKVTREVAEHLAQLAVVLERSGHKPEKVATFLMRCLFTMFAEDVGLLPSGLFRDALKEHWIPNPKAFPGGVQALWRAMDEGNPFGFVGKLLRFNGGLFVDCDALPLTASQLQLLLVAAECNWAEVEPAIFGTLLERALDPKERHALGAHYTPRAYVERLVRPTIEEPWRADWELVQAGVRQQVAAGRVEQARKTVRAFHRRLCSTRVLDPACGSGNFLLVAMDLFKRLESEVLALLAGLGDKQALLAHQETVRVTPGQFLGIEIKRWAKEIAELVLWIGYLQHHYRTHGHETAPPEPILQDFKNIECRDALLAYDKKTPVLDARGKKVSRWDGETLKKSRVTGKDIPDESARVELNEYVNPRQAEWPTADFIVGNPPYLGDKRMREVLGDGYVEALRSTYSDVPASCNLVMYWWNRGAEAVASQKVQRAGFVTTTSINHSFNRRVVERWLEGEVSLAFAVVDHPWTSAKYGQARGNAEVRTAMSVICHGKQTGVLGRVLDECQDEEESVRFNLGWKQGRINADFSIGADVTSVVPLAANLRIACPGVQPHGSGFILTRAEAKKLGLGKASRLERYIKPYVNGNDLASRSRDVVIIDMLGLEPEDVRKRYPAVFERLLTHVKPERDANPRQSYRKYWWLLGEPRKRFRPALSGLKRYIATIESARRRYFVFLDGSVLPDNMVIAIALDDAYFLGVLSSRVHVAWAIATGGRLGVRHDPRYNKSKCFDTFPFPGDATDLQRDQIRRLGEAIDQHRRQQQAAHPTLTLTKLYKALELIRDGKGLAPSDQSVWEIGLGATLLSLHEQLDTAVADAYGWPKGLSEEEIVERLVALNMERAEEEQRGFTRWLRPEFQTASGDAATRMPDEVATPEGPGRAVANDNGLAWPKRLPERVAVVRDTLHRSDAGFSASDVSTIFSGAAAEDVELVLDTLAALGHLVAYVADGTRRFQPVRRSA